MFDELLNLVKEHAGSAVIDNPAVPNEQNDAVCETATNSIIDKLKGMVGSGGTDALSGLLGGGNVANHPEMGNITSGVAQDLMKKFGFDNAIAGNIVSQLIPTVLSKLAGKTNDPNDNSFTMGGILQSLAGGSGGSGGGIMGMLKGLFGSK